VEFICELENVSKNYHTMTSETEAVKEVSIQIRKGEILAIVGPSGCGKSTILSIVYATLKPPKKNPYTCKRA